MSPIGITNVTIINSKSGNTKRNALILFLRSAFLRLCFSGTPSVVNNSAVEIKPPNIKRRDKSRL